jgi:hypothetical protein
LVTFTLASVQPRFLLHRPPPFEARTFGTRGGNSFGLCGAISAKKSLLDRREGKKSLLDRREGLSVASRHIARRLFVLRARDQARPLALPCAVERSGCRLLPWRELGAAGTRAAVCRQSVLEGDTDGRGTSCTHRSRRYRLISAAANQQRRQPAAPLSDCIRSLRTQPHACAAAPTSREALSFRCFLPCQLVGVSGSAWSSARCGRRAPFTY